MKKFNRHSVDEALANMFSNPEYIRFSFYSHMIAQCKIILTDKIPTAGISFKINQYVLYINPDFFDTLPLKDRIGILTHEMLHILFNHVARTEDRDHQIFNIASDCALNQQIGKEFLPNGCIFPDVIKQPENLTSEQYYELLKKDMEENKCDTCDGTGESHDDCESCGGSGETEDENGNKTECEHCKGSGKEPCKDCGGQGTKYQTVDDHSTWEESEGSEELRKDITKNMIEKSIAKSRGNTPQNIEEMLKLFSRKSQVSWKKELRNLVGNKKANYKHTIMRPNRRQPGRMELRGKNKDTIMDVAVLVDTSGSMSNDEIMTGLTEIQHICKQTGVNSMSLIQVDTEVHSIEQFSNKTKVFNRNACGGTYLYPGIEALRQKRIPHSVIVIITDSYHEDISSWEIPPKCKVLFLVSNGQKIPGIDKFSHYKQFNLNMA